MSIKVLVADDSITIQKVIGIIFGGSEYSLTVVDNGKSAVDKAREINPDILLIDALMPGMTGYEVAEAVRSIPALVTKPILILTGSFEPFDEEKAKKCGADDFIAKPFESQQIIAKVKELLELGNARSLATQSQLQEPATEIFQPASEVLNSPFETPISAASADIWSAFTPEVEPPLEAKTTLLKDESSAAFIEPDVFAIVTEEQDAHLLQSAITDDIPPYNTATQWVPAEENAFEFEEEDIAEPYQAVVTEQNIAVQETSFDDIAFEDEISHSDPPAFTAPVPAFQNFTPLESVSVADPSPATPLVSLTEEQLKAAIMAASKEVIERIVWEVVPDLAEALINEAIRKIKEGT